MICIIDYGVGNAESVKNMLRRIQVDCVISSDVDTISSATKLILPGVGHYDEGMRNLAERQLIGPLQDLVINKGRPILGICLGMQLLGKSSEEGQIPGLGWIDMRFLRFRSDASGPIKSQHMGWNSVVPSRSSVIFDNFDPDPRFYFVHRFYAQCASEDDVIATTSYGTAFASAVGHGRIFGVQFHPEKSHRFGMKLLKNFAEAA